MSQARVDILRRQPSRPKKHLKRFFGTRQQRSWPEVHILQSLPFQGTNLCGTPVVSFQDSFVNEFSDKFRLHKAGNGWRGFGPKKTLLNLNRVYFGCSKFHVGIGKATEVTFVDCHHAATLKAYWVLKPEDFAESSWFLDPDVR